MMRSMIHGWGGALLLLLSGTVGCSRTSVEMASAGSWRELHGTMTYRERIALFPNAIARVRMIERAPASGEERIVADTTLYDPAGVPIPFMLRYDERALAGGGSAYRLEGELLEPFGRVIWSGEVGASPAADTAPHILLRYVADNRAPMRTTYFYRCDGIDVTLRVRGGEIGLVFPDTTYVLPQVPAASGARYSEGSVSFWTKGDEALLELDGVTYRECRSDPARAVWEDFRLRGARFRALGNEPGWSLVVYDDPVRMELEVDYGERRLEFTETAISAAADGTMTYEGWGEGHRMSAVVRPEACADVMSGEEFERSVTLRLDEREYSGCGRYLK